ncbi:MAG: NAD(+) diphosphatase [Pseudomonadota bacterium]
MLGRAMQRPNFYAGLGLDRLADRRRDEAWLRARLDDPSTRLVPVWRAKNLVAHGAVQEAAFLGRRDVEGIDAPGVFLGEAEGVAYFAVDVSALAEDALTRLIGARGAFRDLRAAGPLLSHRQGALLAYARGLVHWHSRHRFCGVCGASTTSEAGGHVRACTDSSCAAQHFPRTDPAVIMLVTLEDRCFLARQRHFPPAMHSTLAGFVEPGESLEEAVVREVREEAGLVVREVRYHSSQPWPFPSSIMLGFTASADSEAFRLDPGELETGGWYAREFLSASHDPETFRLPRADSIARRLIEDWLAEG